MLSDLGQDFHQAVLRVDGGMSASDWAMQFLADMTNRPVDRPRVLETTALGAAWLAGFQVGILPDKDTFAKNWALDRTFHPQMNDDTRAQKYQDWQAAVQSTLRF